MLNFFSKNVKKEIKTFQKNIKHILIRDDDILTAKTKEQLAELSASALELQKLDSKKRDIAVHDLKELRRKFNNVFPPKNYRIIREYVEVFIVALTVAFGVRALYVQPFKIPTSSMQPTLFGIHYVEKNVVPDIPQPFNFAVYSTQRAKLNIERSGYLEYIYPPVSKYTFPWTAFKLGGMQYEMPGAPKNVAEYVFQNGSTANKYFEAGQEVCNGWLSQGDHLFVDRFSYHFAPPKRGDIVIFTTEGLKDDASGEPLTSHGFYYVKRLVGIPGDTLKIDSEGMLQVGTKDSSIFRPITAFGKVFERIYSGKGGYQGYTPIGRLARGKEVVVPDNCYFMLGDNTSVSADGRYWGFVPRANIVGKPLFVFWPFSRRWGAADSKEPVDVPTKIEKSMVIPQMYLQ